MLQIAPWIVVTLERRLLLGRRIAVMGIELLRCAERIERIVHRRKGCFRHGRRIGVWIVVGPRIEVPMRGGLRRRVALEVWSKMGRWRRRSGAVRIALCIEWIARYRRWVTRRVETRRVEVRHMRGRISVWRMSGIAM